MVPVASPAVTHDGARGRVTRERNTQRTVRQRTGLMANADMTYVYGYSPYGIVLEQEVTLIVSNEVPVAVHPTAAS